MENSRCVESPDVHRLENWRSCVPGCRESAVEVDTGVKFPLQLPNSIPSSFRAGSSDSGDSVRDKEPIFGEPIVNNVAANSNGDGVIPFMDDDEDQILRIDPKVGEGLEPPRNETCKGGLPLQASDFSQDSAMNSFSHSAVSDSVNADLDNCELLHNDKDVDEVEYGELQDLQQRVPSLIENFDPARLSAAARQPANEPKGQLLRNHVDYKEDGEQEWSLKQSNDELRGSTKVEMGNRNGEMITTRKSKLARRKQRDDKSVFRSEQIDGFRGYDDLDKLVLYVQGPDAEKSVRGDHGKRTKKKSSLSIDCGGGGQPQKKEKAAEINVGARRASSGPVTKHKSTGSAANTDECEVKGRYEKDFASSDGNERCNLSKRDGSPNADESSALQGDLYTESKPKMSAISEKFVDVRKKNQKPPHSDVNISNSSRINRSTTPPPPPPPPATGHGNITTEMNVGRFRRNSYDYSCTAAATAASIIKLASISSSSKQSIRLKDSVQFATTDTILASQALSDSVPFESGVSNLIVEGENGSSKLSFANVASVINSTRLACENEKTDNAITTGQSGLPSDKTSAGDIPESRATVEIPAHDSRNNCIGIPPPPPPSDTSAISDVCVGGTKGLPVQEEILILPESKCGAVPSAITETIDFTCSPPTAFPEDIRTVATPREVSSSSVANVVVDGKSALQMRFASCKNGEISQNLAKQVTATYSTIGGDKVSSQPEAAVQFVGLAAAQPSARCDLTFFFEAGEECSIDTSAAANDRWRKINSLCELAGSGNTSSSASQNTDGHNAAVNSSDDAAMVGKVLQEMLAFAKQAEKTMESSMRKLVKQYMDGSQWESALFWAEIMMDLSSGNVDDVLAYLRCLMELGHYLRALSLLQRRGLIKGHKVFEYFGARCLFASRRYDEVVQLIEASSANCTRVDTTIARTFAASCRVAAPTISTDDASALSRYAEEWRIDAGLLLLLGKAYEKLENRQQAANAYKQCLARDFSCIEAFDRLIRRHMLTETEEKDLLNRLFQQDAIAKPAALTKAARFLYNSKSSMAFFATPLVDGGSSDGGDSEESELKRKLSRNLSLMVAEAERLHYQSKYRESYNLTVKILAEEEYHFDALFVHVVNLAALAKTTQLFSLAHQLIDSFPDLLVSWYAVACYYYSIENYDAAKRFFHKCTLLDPQHGASWIGYGHSFAVEQEHDQAMNCYVKAAKVMSSCHSPLMYVGLEYSLTNNLRLAEKFFFQASNLSPNDPYVLHEIGVLFFRLDNYVKAEEFFKKAENVVGGQTPWEQLWNNTGHVMRKLKRYDEALEYHRRALRLAPGNASTLAAIGYLHMFQEKFEEAVEYFHQSLSLKRDDAFVTALLTKTMDILNDTWKVPFDDPPVLTMPKINLLRRVSPKKAASDAGDAQSDVEMEECN